jgi:hypothetical protein
MMAASARQRVRMKIDRARNAIVSEGATSASVAMARFCVHEIKSSFRKTGQFNRVTAGSSARHVAAHFAGRSARHSRNGRSMVSCAEVRVAQEFGGIVAKNVKYLTVHVNVAAA